MNTKIDFKQLTPYIAGVIIFFVITLVYFGPLWQGKTVKQHDLNTFLGMSKEVVDFREATGEEALWTNSMFGGMPAYQISVAKNENLIRYIDSYLFRLSLPRPADYVFLYMLGFFILLLVLGVDPWLSIIGAIAFGFSSYFIIILEAGHNTKAHAIGYMAPTFAFIIYTFRTRKYLIGGIMFSLFMALELYSNHPQITFYLMFIVLAYGAGELWGAIKEKEFAHFGKSVGVLAIGLLLALSVNTENYWTTLEYSPTTIRGKSELTFDKHIKSAGLDKDYATQWSYGKGETFNLMIPNAKGGASVALQNYAPKALEKADPRFRKNLAGMGSYWGEQPMTSGPTYIGAVVIFLFVLGLFIVKGRFKWSILVVTLISVFLSWGHNLMWFTDIFFDYFPGYDKFRTVSMILVIAQFTTVMLAFMAVNEIIKKPEIIKENAKALYIAFGLTGGLSILFYIMPETFFSFLSNNDQNQLASLQSQYPEQASIYQELFDDLVNIRISIFKSDSFRSFAFILLSAGLLFVYSLKKFNKAILIIGLGFLIVADIITVDYRFLNNDSYQRKSKAKIPYRATAADMQILKDKELDYRVFNTTVSPFNDASTSYYHKSIGGYHGAKLRRYQDLIEHHLSVSNMAVFNMLNTKYFIVGGRGQAPQVQQNPDRLGNAWFVKNTKWVNNADEEIIHLGKVIRIEAKGDISNIEVYGRALKQIDTILNTSALMLGDKRIDLGRLPLQSGIKYIIGNNPKRLDSNFIDLSKIQNGELLSNNEFTVEVIFDFKPQNTAVIDKKFKSYFEKNKYNYLPSSTIYLVEYKPNYLKYNTNAKDNQLAVFSEIYYKKGWNAYIDGVKKDYIRADYVLRAMVIPSGSHVVEFKFEPQSYFIGRQITFASSLLIILLVIGVIVMEGKRMKERG